MWSLFAATESGFAVEVNLSQFYVSGPSKDIKTIIWGSTGEGFSEIEEKRLHVMIDGPQKVKSSAQQDGEKCVESILKEVEKFIGKCYTRYSNET